MELIFASHNENKVREIRAVLPESIRVLSLNDIGFHEEIAETGSSLEENAQIKAETIYNQTGKNVFADDSGLFVEALDGAPGVYSSRYAGTGNSKDNISKLLKNLEKYENKNASFQTVFCVIINGKLSFLKGEVHGKIIDEEKGNQGFGYDSVFKADGFHETFAEMSSEAKNQISHRTKAVQKLITFIENL